jgi:hypothetical protein
MMFLISQLESSSSYSSLYSYQCLHASHCHLCLLPHIMSPHKCLQPHQPLQCTQCASSLHTIQCNNQAHI